LSPSIGHRRQLRDNKEAEMGTEGVDTGHEQWLAAMRAGDAEAIGRLVTEDVILMPPHHPSVVGRQAAVDWFSGVAKQARTTAITMTRRAVTVAGDVAIEEGAFIWELTPTGGGSPIEDHGRVLATWKRQPDGSWKIAQNMWNSTLALPTTASGAEKAAVQRWILGVWDRGELSLVDELASDSYSYTAPGRTDLRRQAFKAFVTDVRSAFPDLQNTISGQLAEGNKVVTIGTTRGTHHGTFAGIAATGRGIVIPWVVITEFHGGKIANESELFDALSLMQQLGAMPAAT
jgi:steroid delta-isomerase-like uncharacterized protein